MLAGLLLAGNLLSGFGAASAPAVVEQAYSGGDWSGHWSALPRKQKVIDEAIEQAQEIVEPAIAELPPEVRASARWMLADIAQKQAQTFEFYESPIREQVRYLAQLAVKEWRKEQKRKRDNEAIALILLAL